MRASKSYDLIWLADRNHGFAPRQCGDGAGRRVRFVAIAATALALIAAADPPAAITVQVGNVRNAKGRVRVDICSEAAFLGDRCAYAGNAPAHAGVTTVIVRGVPAGRYAAQAFHDENDNGKVDRALFGIPKEGVGFSNDAPIRLAPPKFAAAAFDLDGRPRTIALRMRYFLGAAGPGGR